MESQGTVPLSSKLAVNEVDCFNCYIPFKSVEELPTSNMKVGHIVALNSRIETSPSHHWVDEGDYFVQVKGKVGIQRVVCDVLKCKGNAVIQCNQAR